MRYESKAYVLKLRLRENDRMSNEGKRKLSWVIKNLRWWEFRHKREKEFKKREWEKGVDKSEWVEDRE